MTDLINHMKGYSASVKVWNKATFNDSLYAFPKKGFAPYNQVQKLRLGQDITPLKTVKQMEKPEEPIKIVKPKPEAKKEEAKKEEAKKDKPEAKKSQKKSKPKTEVAKEKAQKKEKAVKQAIQAIIKEEAPVNQVVDTDDAPPTLVIKEIDELGDLEKTVARMEALEKMAETSGYYKSEDGKKIQSEFLELQKELKKYNDHHEHEMLKKKNPELAKRVNGRVLSDTISGIWANRIHDEMEKAKEDAVPQTYRNSLKTYNDPEYWKKTSAKEKKEYLASVYGMKASDQEYITKGMRGALEKAYKAYVKKMKATAENK